MVDEEKGYGWNRKVKRRFRRITNNIGGKVKLADIKHHGSGMGGC
jgi:hypothetical protein